MRPSNSVYLAPKIIRLKGKSAVEEIAVIKKDMPNFFVEVMTVSGGKVYHEARQIAVPPEKRVLDVKITPAGKKKRFKPGEKTKVRLQLVAPPGGPPCQSIQVLFTPKSLIRLPLLRWLMRPVRRDTLRDRFGRGGVGDERMADHVCV